MKKILAILCLVLTSAFPADFTNPGFIASLHQPTEEAPVTPLALNLTTNIAFGAWSVTHLLNTNYSGPLFTASRLDGSVTNDILAVGGVLNSNLLISMSGGGDVYVSRIYDQSGNNRHLQTTETNRWPLIVTSGAFSVAGPGSFPLAARWNGESNTNRLASSASTLAIPVVHFTSIYQRTSVTGDFILGGNSTTAGLRQTTGNAIRMNAGATGLDTGPLSLSTWYAIYAEVNSSSTDVMQVNNLTQVTGDAGNNGIVNDTVWGSITICAAFNGTYWICFSSIPTSGDRAIIRDHLNSLYGNAFYTP